MIGNQNKIAMETTVKLRHIKQSARKVRFILNEVRGMKVDTALEKLFISNKKASLTIKKAIESGVANLINLEKERLPFWEDDFEGYIPPYKEAFKNISIKLHESDGFVFVVPEWGGMVPSQVKNIFLLASNNEFAHKPGLIVTLSESLGGSYPVVELRSFSYKNTKICWVPDHVIIRKVKEFDPDKDLRLNSRLDYSCKMLLEYSKALVSVRNAADLKTFKNGM